MKQVGDKVTLDIFGAKQLGRPVTGKAKSAAQRKRESRARQAAHGGVITVNLDSVTLQRLDALAKHSGRSVAELAASLIGSALVDLSL